MNSDDYFTDVFNSAILNQIDVIEAAHRPKLTHNPPPKSLYAQKEDSFTDLSFDINDADLQHLDSVDAAYKHQTAPVAGPSNAGRPLSKNSVQTTLFGDIAHPPASSKAGPPSRGPMQRSKSDHRNPFGQQAPKTKQWDHTAFAKSGWKKPKSKGKGKSVEDEPEDEAMEFEQFPAPFIQGTY